MISKPLFKQSCKANSAIWAFVTGITCFMLAIIILVLGNLNVNEIRQSMTDMFVSDAIESTIDEQSMTYYNMADTSLNSYTENVENLTKVLNSFSKEQKQTTISTYVALVTAEGDNKKTDAEAKEIICASLDENQKMATIALINYYVAQDPTLATDGGDESLYTQEKISTYILNQVADGVYEQVKEEQGEETATTARDFIQQAIASFVESEETDATAYASTYIPALMKDLFFEQSFDYEGETIYISSYFTKDQIQQTSQDSIISYKAKMEFKEQELRKETDPQLTEEEISEQLAIYSKSIIADMSKTLVESLPEKVASSLSEIGDLDVYGLVIGSIFYRIAGLLLPMIFVIMTANNLIAGQVDSGSMAYVLSTPTKRRTVTITQMAYLICSLFAMFALTTITSVVCLAIVSSPEITITYGQILLLNLGAFITMFAISGICFLASSLFNRSKMSMSIGGGLSMFFLVATILGLFGSSVIPSAIRIDAMHYFNYVSIISLFDATSILAGSLTYLWKFAILIVVGIVTYLIGIFKFDKKDLPL